MTWDFGSCTQLDSTRKRPAGRRACALSQRSSRQASAGGLPKGASSDDGLHPFDNRRSRGRNLPASRSHRRSGITQPMEHVPTLIAGPSRWLHDLSPGGRIALLPAPIITPRLSFEPVGSARRRISGSRRWRGSSRPLGAVGRLLPDLRVQTWRLGERGSVAGDPKTRTRDQVLDLRNRVEARRLVEGMSLRTAASAKVGPGGVPLGRRPSTSPPPRRRTREISCRTRAGSRTKQIVNATSASHGGSSERSLFTHPWDGADTSPPR